jgi:hypothetical protein
LSLAGQSLVDKTMNWNLPSLVNLASFVRSEIHFAVIPLGTLGTIVLAQSREIISGLGLEISLEMARTTQVCMHLVEIPRMTTGLFLGFGPTDGRHCKDRTGGGDEYGQRTTFLGFAWSGDGVLIKEMVCRLRWSFALNFFCVSRPSAAVVRCQGLPVTGPGCQSAVRV